MRTTLSSIFTAALVAASLSNCRTTVSLDYLANPGRGTQGPAAFAVGQFYDRRGVKPTSIGRINVPGVSNIVEVPLERVRLGMPVSEAVRNAFAHALNARKMLAGPARQKLLIAGDVLELHCELYKNPYATVTLCVNLVDAVTGRVLHSKTYKTDRQSVFFEPGAMDPVPLMRDLTARTLQDAVDLALDDPGMRAVMRAHLK